MARYLKKSYTINCLNILTKISFLLIVSQGYFRETRVFHNYLVLLMAFMRHLMEIPLLFLIYINDLPDGLESNSKPFADHTSIFSVVKDNNVSSNTL